MIQGSDPDSGKRFFLSLKHPDWLWGPPSFLFTGGTSAEARNGYYYTSTLPVCLMAWTYAVSFDQYLTIHGYVLICYTVLVLLEIRYIIIFIFFMSYTAFQI
jgi:hypothetical protein